jgi:NAD(P)-dependent dehydrogenase (short-subunit alcohol dehydrogenase family)
LEGQDGRCFHLTDPHPRRVGDILNIFARAAHAPSTTIRVNAALLNLVPRGVARGLMALTPIQRIRKAIMSDLALPDGILAFVNYPTRFDCRDAERLLKPAGIVVPPLEDYAWRLWDYWERTLDPDLFVDRTLRGRVAGRVVLITGGSSGIGLAAALKLAAADGVVIIAARDPVKLETAQREAKRRGLSLVAKVADITEPSQCDALVKWIAAEHGGVDILINNAGRSIRRGIENSFDRLHDFERMMQINYFGALRLTLAVLPGMTKKKSGHVINISSIGTLTNAPRFSAYLASKAALEAWTRCAASEFLDVGVEFTTINMPLVRTAMIAPTRFYEQVPALSPEEAADFVIDAVVRRPARIATRLGLFGEIVQAVAPRIGQIVMNTSFRMFPDSAAARGEAPGTERATADQSAFAQLLRGIHL